MSRVTYQEAETYISELPKFTKKNTLEHTQKFLSFLGNPQNGKKVIHVAGTNGKGSVCVYLDAMLRAQRKHTGLFTSPHLIRMNERIRMDGEPVSDETFTRLFLRTQQSVRRMEAEGLPHPSFFEFLFGMAMAGFEEAGVEYVILETGLGGRLDATNSISGPLTCILTSIGLDHTEILGNTLEEIAAEKAGILKPHVPVIFADTQQESSRVIEERAGELGCPCKKSREKCVRNSENSGRNSCIFSVKCVLWRYYMEIAEHCHVSAGKCHACHGGHAYDLRRAGRCLWMERGTFAGEVGRQNGRDSAGFLCRRRSQCECGKDVCAEYPKRQTRKGRVIFCCQREKLRRDDPDSLSGEERQRICDHSDRR